MDSKADVLSVRPSSERIKGLTSLCVVIDKGKGLRHEWRHGNIKAINKLRERKTSITVEREGNRK